MLDPLQNSWFRCQREAGSGLVRLLCFSFAGAGASMFAPWQRLLPPWIELWSVQLPGREERQHETLLSNMADVVEALVAAWPRDLGAATAFFGHSMGGLLAYELARALCARNVATPAHLFVSATRAPQHVSGPPYLHELPTDEFVAELRKRFTNIPDEVFTHEELRDFFLARMRADLAVVETYCHRPGPVLPLPITAFAGTRDALTPPRMMTGWRAHSEGPFELKLFEDNHFFCQSQLPQVISAITVALSDTLSGSHPDRSLLS